jgi:EmrB/QacA subfamily drug resistance transporter
MHTTVPSNPPSAQAEGDNTPHVLIKAPAQTPRPTVILIILSAVFMSLLDMFVVNVAFPAIARNFEETNTAGLSWVLNAYAIVFAAMLVPAGRWTDQAGRKRGFLLGLAIFTVASALCASASSVWMLIGARIVQAAGAALISPAAMGLLLTEFPPSKRTNAVALFVAVGGAAAAFGTPVGGLLAQLNWRWIFLINLPVGFVALFAGARVLREGDVPGTKRSADLLGAILLAGSVASLVLGIEKGQDWGWTGGRVAGVLLASISLFAWFVWRSRWHPAPVVELPMLALPGFAAANLSAFLFSTAFAGMILVNVLFLSRVWHLASWQLGLELTAGPFTAALVAVPTGRFIARYGAKRVAGAGGILFALGCGWMILSMSESPAFLVQVLPASLLVGMGIGLSLPSSTAAGVSNLPPSRFSTGSAVLNMSRQVGSAVGVAVLVAIIGGASRNHDLQIFRYGFLAPAIAALGSAVAAFGFKRAGQSIE